MISASQHGTTSPADRDWQPIETDHRELGAVVERLEEWLGRLAAGSRSGEPEVRSLLADFCQRLRAHLGAEEQSGVLERAAAAAPHFAGRIDRLRLEHDELRRGLEMLAAGPEPAIPRPDWPRFHARFQVFRGVLDAHEHAEIDILQRSYLEDLGGGG
ncbi:MAG: hemerythrin domain-containing protein [Myxococcota bacterium]|nr:hemerythrin domain-containing protein [Myxococcota bacterium]